MSVVVSCKGPKGSKKIMFEHDTTVAQFINIVATEMSLEPSSIGIKVGFPPRSLSIDSLEVPCTSVGIKNMESLFILEDPSESLYAQWGIQEESKHEDMDADEPEHIRNNPALMKIAKSRHTITSF